MLTLPLNSRDDEHGSHSSKISLMCLVLCLGNSWCLLRNAHTRWAPTNYRLGYDFNYRGWGVTTVTPVTQFINNRPFPQVPPFITMVFPRKRPWQDVEIQSNSGPGLGPGIGDTLDATLLQSLPASFDAELYLGSISGAFVS